ncbi:MAG TPA: hypothetical protein VK983_01360 [Candidatus Limnocylindrales bacterium]|nr:hypothetical protein [Candidatus Limnocylindrales bacterium]
MTYIEDIELSPGQKLAKRGVWAAAGILSLGALAFLANYQEQSEALRENRKQQVIKLAQADGFMANYNGSYPYDGDHIDYIQLDLGYCNLPVRVEYTESDGKPTDITQYNFDLNNSPGDVENYTQLTSPAALGTYPCAAILGASPRN